jgi:hypothetical protein
MAGNTVLCSEMVLTARWVNYAVQEIELKCQRFASRVRVRMLLNV